MAPKATEMSASCSAQRRPALPSALRRADPTRSLCVWVLDSTGREVFFSKESVGFGPHGGLELLNRRRLDELVCQGGLLHRFSPCLSRHGDRKSDVPKPAMAVLHTIAFSGDDGAEASDDSSVTQKHVEQVDASSDELEILEAESVAAATMAAAADARLRFLRARRTSAQVSQASARSASSASGPAVRPLWLLAVEDFPDRGPLATVSLAPPVVRRAAEPAHRTAFRQQEMIEEG